MVLKDNVRKERDRARDEKWRTTQRFIFIWITKYDRKCRRYLLHDGHYCGVNRIFHTTKELLNDIFQRSFRCGDKPKSLFE
ncbi:hypothetical protein CEXT_547731 [Caerostris extrusa]|uniref:Uncharacterized protein n=1 Tax=Caerostris extrusa TaxID=172846 RepID=A0AAV4S363_CAEEX|nr:hypothetical protein CEXT_547731 [Caerostris extrusa]